MTLTQAALITKRTILILGIVIFLILTSTVGSSLYYRYQISQIPKVEEKAEIKYGQLPKPNFPLPRVSSANYSYSVDTNTGELPQVPLFIKIYFIPQAGLTLLAPDRARNIAQGLGFSNGPQTEEQNKYIFSDDSGGKLKIDVLTANFSFQKQATPSAQIQNNSLSKDSLATQFINFLSSKVQLPKELSQDRANVIGDIVTLWPQNIDDLPVVTANYSLGLTKGQFTVKEDGGVEFNSVDYVYWPVDTTSFSTYPLKTAQAALSDLKNGEGYISIEPKNPQVSITSVKLAYFQSETYSPYLQPVFIFEGPSFVALVPAINQ